MAYLNKGTLYKYCQPKEKGRSLPQEGCNLRFIRVNCYREGRQRGIRRVKKERLEQRPTEAWFQVGLQVPFEVPQRNSHVSKPGLCSKIGHGQGMMNGFPVYLHPVARLGIGREACFQILTSQGDHSFTHYSLAPVEVFIKKLKRGEHQGLLPWDTLR